MNDKIFPVAVGSALVVVVAASSDQAQTDRPPVSIGGPALPNLEAERTTTPFDAALGDLLWDNGLSFRGGKSHLTIPVRRSLLDDFEVDEPGWKINRFDMKMAWADGSTGVGTDLELVVFGDAGGRPDFDQLIAVAENRAFTEVLDPDNPDFFGLTVMDMSVTFDEIQLDPGIYWLDMHVVGPANGFHIDGTYPQAELEQCWVDYEDFGGRQPGDNIFATQYDLTMYIFGELDCSAGCPVYADSFTVNFGAHQSGGVNDLRDSDDSYLVIEPRPGVTANSPIIRTDFRGNAAVESASSITVTFEASANSVPTQPPQRLSLFNYDTNTYEIIDERIATSTDSVVEVSIDTNAARFIETGSEDMIMRAEYFNPGNVFLPSWVVRVDQAVWTVVPWIGAAPVRKSAGRATRGDLPVTWVKSAGWLREWPRPAVWHRDE